MIFRAEALDVGHSRIEFLHNYCYYKKMMNLTSKQRKELEKASHSLEPVVIVGQNGVSESLLKMVNQCLDVHELIKVKFNDFKDEKQVLTAHICNATDATLVRIIGNIAILFKQQEDPKKRKIKIKFD